MKIGRLAHFQRQIKLIESSPEVERGLLYRFLVQQILSEISVERPNKAGLGREVDRLVAQGKKIAAIKFYREQTGIGLKEAKEWVESRQTPKMITITPKMALKLLGPNTSRRGTKKGKKVVGGVKPRLRHRPKPKKKKRKERVW